MTIKEPNKGNAKPRLLQGMDYNFLFKPLFFICSLLFATWLVLYIERISPSDLGKYESLFKVQSEPGDQTQSVYDERQQVRLKRICNDYKAGLIDSAGFDQQLEIILNGPGEASPK